MEIYTTLSEALNSIDFRIIYWQFQESDNIFDRNALLNIADQLEPIFNPEGLNYYMPRPDGEILLLLMREKQIMSIFTPYEMKGDQAPVEPAEEATKQEPVEEVPVEEPVEEVSAQETAEEAPEQDPAEKELPVMRFCPECGAPLKPGAMFCGECGKRLSK